LRWDRSENPFERHEQKIERIADPLETPKNII
jgi:hypothetical protein